MNASSRWMASAVACFGSVGRELAAGVGSRMRPPASGVLRLPRCLGHSAAPRLGTPERHREEPCDRLRRNWVGIVEPVANGEGPLARREGAQQAVVDRQNVAVVRIRLRAL